MNARTAPCSGNESGFSLVEVLVSILLLGFVALGIQATMTATFRQNRLALERSEATNLAAARMAQITAMPLQGSASFTAYALPEETANTGPPITLTTGYGVIPGLPQFTRIVTFTYNTPVTGVLKVQVDIIWANRGQGGALKTHRVITFVYPDLATGS